MRTSASTQHHGVDPLALVAGGGAARAHGRIVSGGSTLTMQVARLLEPRAERTLVAKLRQIVRAVELERRSSKREMLALYLELAPYGGNLEGVRAASLAYFGKEPKRLTLGEAALLVALPQSPEARRPDRSPRPRARRARPRARPRRRAGLIAGATEIAQAQGRAGAGGAHADAVLAPHAADEAGARRARPATRASPDHRRGPAGSLEELAARTRPRALGPDMSAAILVVDNATGEVLRPGRLRRLFRRAPRRPGRHDAGAALARLDPEAVHLRPGLRGRPHPSRRP